MPCGWEGKLGRLVPNEVDLHLDNATKWMNDLDVTQYLTCADFPTSKLSERDCMGGHGNTTERSVTLAIETAERKYIGFP